MGVGKAIGLASVLLLVSLCGQHLPRSSRNSSGTRLWSIWNAQGKAAAAPAAAAAAVTAADAVGVQRALKAADAGAADDCGGVLGCNTSHTQQPAQQSPPTVNQTSSPTPLPPLSSPPTPSPPATPPTQQQQQEQHQQQQQQQQQQPAPPPPPPPPQGWKDWWGVGGGRNLPPKASPKPQPSPSPSPGKGAPAPAPSPSLLPPLPVALAPSLTSHPSHSGFVGSSSNNLLPLNGNGNNNKPGSGPSGSSSAATRGSSGGSYVPSAAAAGTTSRAVIKSVSDVTAGDSCICWSPDECTCGQQSCPYAPTVEEVRLSDPARALFQSDCLPDLKLSANAVKAMRAPQISRSLLQRYNKRLSTQLIGPLYQFTQDHYILEGAKQVLAAGGDSYKFRLKNEDVSGQEISKINTILDMVRSPSLPYADIFDLPLTAYFMWVFPNYKQPYKDTFEFTAYLLQKYQGTGKQFFIGMWEGDNAMRSPDKQGRQNQPVIERIESLTYVVQEKQRAVDDAKRVYTSCQEVYVWNYIEANYVIDSVWNRSAMGVANFLIPAITDPPMDYVSYSAYDTMIGQPKDWKLHNLTAALDYLAQRLPAKPSVPGPRVFLGEWAYPLAYSDGSLAYTPEQTRTMSLYAAAVAIAWGSQYNIYWQLYNNVKLSNGTGDRGYWLITRQAKGTPLWISMKEYFAAAHEFLARFLSCFGGWPSDYTYRVWAVKNIMKLLDNSTYPEPKVRDIATTNLGKQAHIIADNLYGQFGWTITYGPDTAAGSTAGTSAQSSSDPADYRIFQGENGSPLVPQYLTRSADRGRCPIPLPMLMPSAPVPPPSPPSPPPKPDWLLNPPRKSEGNCGGFEDVKDMIKIEGPSCPFDYPKINVQDVMSGKSKPYTYGGIDRIGCANCQQKGLWPRFCTWRRTEVESWDKVNCNQRENYGRVSVQKNLEFSSNITQFWPASSGIPGVLSAKPPGGQLTPGPVEITPCDVWRLIRGRTLWVIGDSEMKGLFIALKCFLLEFFDLKQYSPSWNTTINDYFKSLPYDAEAKCIHMADATRICQLKVLWADVFVERPGPNEKRWSMPVMQLLHQYIATPDDIFALNFGLWYDPKNPARYQANLQSLGRAYQATKQDFPNVFFLETVKLHWPGPPGDQDGGPSGNFLPGTDYLEQCTPTADIEFHVQNSTLSTNLNIGTPAAAAAGGAAGAAVVAAPAKAGRRIILAAQQQQQQQPCIGSAAVLQRISLLAEAAVKAAAAAAAAAHDAATMSTPLLHPASSISSADAHLLADAAAARAQTAAAAAAGLAALAARYHLSGGVDGCSAALIQDEEQLLDVLHYLDVAEQASKWEDLQDMMAYNAPSLLFQGNDTSGVQGQMQAVAAAAAETEVDATPDRDVAAAAWTAAAAAAAHASSAREATSVVQLQPNLFAAAEEAVCYSQVSRNTDFDQSSSSGSSSSWAQAAQGKVVHLCSRIVGFIHKALHARSSSRQTEATITGCVHVARRHLLAAAKGHNSTVKDQNPDDITSAYASAATAYASAADAFAAAAAAQAAAASAQAKAGDAKGAAAAASAAGSTAQLAAVAAQNATGIAAKAAAVAGPKPGASPSPWQLSSPQPTLVAYGGTAGAAPGASAAAAAADGATVANTAALVPVATKVPVAAAQHQKASQPEAALGPKWKPVQPAAASTKMTTSSTSAPPAAAPLPKAAAASADPWVAAPPCKGNGPLTADRAGRLWGYENGVSCAFKPAASDTTATGAGASPAAPPQQPPAPQPLPSPAAAAASAAQLPPASQPPVPTPPAPPGPLVRPAQAPKPDGVTTFPDFNSTGDSGPSGTDTAASPAPVPSPALAIVAAEDAVSNVMSGLWRNKIAREVLRDTYNVPWVPISNATVPPFWGHRNQPEAPDCIHYCNPGVPQNWIAQLFLAISMRVKPMEGTEAADARCMWGSEQVYDTGEKEFVN